SSNEPGHRGRHPIPCRRALLLHRRIAIERSRLFGCAAVYRFCRRGFLAYWNVERRSSPGWLREPDRQPDPDLGIRIRLPRSEKLECTRASRRDPGGRQFGGLPSGAKAILANFALIDGPEFRAEATLLRDAGFCFAT